MCHARTVIIYSLCQLDGRNTKQMNKTTKINILAYASEPDKNTKYEGDYINYQGKRYFVSLAEERVEFVGLAREE
jgi:hypothetical protein